jgi:hypothetical protein
MNFGPIEVVEKQPITTEIKQYEMVPDYGFVEERTENKEYETIHTGKKIPIYKTTIKTKLKKTKVKKERFVDVQEKYEVESDEMEIYSSDEEYMATENYQVNEWDYWTQKYYTDHRSRNIMKTRKIHKIRYVPKTRTGVRWTTKKEEYESEDDGVEQYEDKEIIGYEDEVIRRWTGKCIYRTSKVWKRKADKQVETEFTKIIGYEILGKRVEDTNYRAIATVGAKHVLANVLNNLFIGHWIFGTIGFFVVMQTLSMFYQYSVLSKFGKENFRVSLKNPPAILLIVNCSTIVVVMILFTIFRKRIVCMDERNFWWVLKEVFSCRAHTSNLEIETKEFMKYTGLTSFPLKQLTQQEIEEELKPPEYEYSATWKSLVIKNTMIPKEIPTMHINPNIYETEPIDLLSDSSSLSLENNDNEKPKSLEPISNYYTKKYGTERRTKFVDKLFVE